MPIPHTSPLADASRRQRFLADILIGAVEGGTGYWAQVSAYRHKCPASETRARLHEIEPAGGEESVHQVTPETIAKGIRTILASPTLLIRRDLLHAIKQADQASDAGCLDAGAVDVIVQVGLFGEILYG